MARDRRPRGALVWTALAVAGGATLAAMLAWSSDDAFISFRYARNLVEGHGLVFNPGERVEGYTNPLWTVWVAAGLALGLSAEAWASAWGIACYGGSIALLALEGGRGAPQVTGVARAVPFAALAAVAHRDWAVWATGGLETSMFTFLLLAGYVVAVRAGPVPRRAAAAGAVLALAALTRHDGILVAAILGAWCVLRSTSRSRTAAAFGGAFLALWLPCTVARWAYYGDVLPNTYYAKSAYLAWWGQGARYLQLYLERYWILLASLPLLVVAARRRRGRAVGDSSWPAALPAAAVATVYTLYVVRVGGDFMFARLLIPATPFYLLLLDLGLRRAFGPSRVAGALAGAGVLAALALTPAPVSGSAWRYGIADERRYYSAARVADLEHEAAVLAPFFEGLPVRMAFYGDEARVVYLARPAVAIESHAGLTEPAVARRRLESRGRVGHEKHPSVRYLIEERRAHLTFSSVPGDLLDLDRVIPDVVVRFGEDVYGRVLHWDPALMRALAERGARVPDFPSALDRLIAGLDRMPDAEVASLWERLRPFYFDPAHDPVREAAFRARLDLGR